MYGHRPGDIDLSVAFCTCVCMPNMKYHISKFNNMARIKGFSYTDELTDRSRIRYPQIPLGWGHGMNMYQLHYFN